MLRKCAKGFLKSRECLGVFLNRSYCDYFKFAHLDVSDEVMSALKDGKPVVALESTIITHGMPYPENVRCCTEVEQVVREQGAIPATIAVLKGRIKVGMDSDELSLLADVKTSVPIKTSRRDFGYVISTKRNGGTTVSGTLSIATTIGIPVFATGGIGGVHRRAETTFDVSADLVELGRSPVAVISSGVKSILDIPKTLEYLETQGVFVATFGDTKDFPAFYCRSSRCEAPYNVKSANDAAKIIKTNRQLGLTSGMLFAVPVPAEFALDEDHLNGVIEEALEDAQKNGVSGKKITPYLLERISKITGGKSLETNIALVKNNAKIAADIAIELSKIDGKGGGGDDLKTKGENSGVGRNVTNKPVIIGGSVVDTCARLTETEIKLDGRIHDGTFSRSAGGVARNVCEALTKMGCNPIFLSAVGDDVHGHHLRSLLPERTKRHVHVLPDQATAQCAVIFDGNAECRFLIGDMNIHGKITPKMVIEIEDSIKNSPLLVLDANLNDSTMETALRLAHDHKTPVLFEPTDIPISAKPFASDYRDAIKIITPNLMELENIARFFNVRDKNEQDDRLIRAKNLAVAVAEYVQIVIVTLGPSGLIIARRGSEMQPLLQDSPNDKITARHYLAKKTDSLVNVSGAGDCFVAGLIMGILQKAPEKHCIYIGLEAAYESLKSHSAVPAALNSAANYTIL